ncbi:TetR/AcrR family transcriptional regulator [Paenibacillus sp. CGMCC 1.16610]|uniref:TetR family transcriptional regulator n=2 Tax=Paenibacillus TaxID=44249 RepID=A0ABW9U889_9BACL|nr:TetR/AcrR family transcriptional regulator [Paenibacillus sp. CGMCC 1.16610]MVQ36213.1 TetR family transcriptional regulator [Paenibacillus anseongense]
MKVGFQNLRMDDIAKAMDVSRATMYKHFSSKEEVIDGVVRMYTDYLDKLEDRTSNDSEQSFGIWFQQIFEQSVMLVGQLTEVFLLDLQSAYPELYEQLKEILNKREQQTLKFYQDGKHKGIFNDINEKLILLQDNLLLREIATTKYLVYNQTTIKQVLLDYYQFKKIQLFKADKLSSVDDSNIGPRIDHLVNKFNQTL